MMYEEYIEEVNSPGKFERQQPYVPYFWYQWPTDDDGVVKTFKVSAEDRKIFPELKGIRWVRLQEDNQGFVNEV